MMLSLSIARTTLKGQRIRDWKLRRRPAAAA
jgi:hypothetical protein